MLEKIQVTEHPEDNTWEISFYVPAYQAKETIFVDEKTAKEILSIKYPSLKNDPVKEHFNEMMGDPELNLGALKIR